MLGVGRRQILLLLQGQLTYGVDRGSFNFLVVVCAEGQLRTPVSSTAVTFQQSDEKSVILRTQRGVAVLCGETT